MLLARDPPTRLISSVLVTARHRSADCHAGLEQGDGVAGAAADGLHVELLAGQFQHLRVGVDEADVVPAAAERLADARPDRPAAEDHDVHRLMLSDSGRGGGGGS